MTVAYPKYRSAGVEWLDVVPSHWNHVPIRHLFRRVKRTGFGNETLLSVYRDYGVIEKASRTDNFNNASEDLDSYQLVEPGDLAINKMKAWQGSVAISTIRGIVSPAYFIYRPSHDADPAFLHFLFRSGEYVSAYALFSKGVRINQWDLDPEQHLSMTVNLPPLDEQRQIAKYLNREVGKIDELIAKQQQVVKLLVERHAGEVHAAVTSGLDANAHTHVRNSEYSVIGEVPLHWEALQLKHVIRSQTSGTSVLASDVPATEGEVGVLKTSSVSTGVFKPHENKTVLEDEVSRLACPVRGGTVLVNRANSPAYVGAACFVETSEPSLYLSDKLWQIEFGAVDARFISWWMHTNKYRDQVGFQIVGASSSMQNLSYEAFRQIRFAAPPIAEQTAIADFLDKAASKVADLVQKSRAAVALLRERRAALISAAVTGKIDVRGL
jgi:type I restriction enzyme, S subunit